MNVESILLRENELLKSHYVPAEVRSKCQELHKSWENLCNSMDIREKLLIWGIQKEQYFSDLSEIEEWIAEKNRFWSLKLCSA